MRKVILIGDSIALAYGPVVRELLAGWADVWQPEENAGTSAHLLERLSGWILTQEADLLHVNCGLHDLAIDPGAPGPRVPLEAFTENLRALRRTLEATSARITWATITPVIDEWHQATKGFARHEEDVRRYNTAALHVMAGLPINDLHTRVLTVGCEQCLAEDGVHMNDSGNHLLAEAVAAHLRRLG